MLFYCLIQREKTKLIVIFNARHFEVFFVGSSKVAVDDECTVWRVDDVEVLSFTHTHNIQAHIGSSHTNLISFRGENANSMEIVTLSSEQWMCNATFSSYYFASVFIHLFFRFCFCAVMTFSSGRTHTLTLTCVFGYEFRYLMKFWVW